MAHAIGDCEGAEAQVDERGDVAAPEFVDAHRLDSGRLAATAHLVIKEVLGHWEHALILFEATIGEVLCVKGYIVASCTRSMKNADFMEPFDGSPAIILADEPVDLEYFQFESDEHLFPVCLTDYKDVRAALNLEDNPSLWNKQIFIMGVKSRYMSCPGLKKVLQYQVAE